MISVKKETYKVDKATKYHKFRGSERLSELVSKMENPIVYLDPDVDGVFSGFLVIQWLCRLGKKYSWYINTNREHGWTLDLEKARGRDIIAVDFLITPEVLKDIVDHDCNLISMDHHENVDYFIEYVNKNGNYGFVINNQYPFEEEDSRYLSGAGVVFESVIAADPSFETLVNRCIVGITLLSDIRNIENPLAHGYLYDLYNHKYKGYIRYLIDGVMGEKDFGFGVPRLDRNFVDFKFSPALNACFRFNQEDMVVKFVLGSGILDLEYHKMQKELVDTIQNSMTMKQFSNLRVCFFKKSDISSEYWDVLSSFVGLTASQYLDGVHSCVCYMIDTDNTNKPYVKRASFRGNVNGLEYRKAMLGYINGIGHGSAFGIKTIIPSRNLFNKVNEICGSVEEDSNYTRDIVKVMNMSMFVNSYGFEYGEYNMYCLSQHRKLVRYIGRNISRKQTSANYIEYEVDGIIVKCFDKKLDFTNGLVSLINERGNLCLYLEESGE